MADGSDPCFDVVKSATLDGEHFIISAGDKNHQLDVVGSLVDGRVGWGQNGADPISHPTIYIRKDGIVPTVDNVDLEVAQVDSGFNTSFQFQKIISSYEVTKGRPEGQIRQFQLAAVKNRSASRWEVEDLAAVYCDQHAWEAGSNNAANEIIVRRSVGFWTGHRNHTLTSDGIVRAYNCIGLFNHVHLLVQGTTVPSSAIMEVKNNIQYGGEASSFDFKSNITDDMSNNHWYPGLELSGDNNSRLGYLNPTNFPTTPASDNPPNFSTSQLVTQAELKDPMFVNVDPKKYENCDFRLKAGSPCIAAGIQISGVNDGNDAAGVAYHDLAPNIGLYSGFVSSGNLGGGTITIDQEPGSEGYEPTQSPDNTQRTPTLGNDGWEVPEITN